MKPDLDCYEGASLIWVQNVCNIDYHIISSDKQADDNYLEWLDKS